MNLDKLSADLRTCRELSARTILLPNPSCKLIGYLGMPIKERRFTVDGFRQRECIFRLPKDWYELEASEEGDFDEVEIVARQDGTSRVVAVHPFGPSHSSRMAEVIE